MRFSWWNGSRLLGRAARRSRRNGGSALRVRQLERRRVLDAAVQSLVVTAITSTESTTTTSTSDTQTTQPPVTFDWTPPPGSSLSSSQSADLAQGAGVNADPVLVVPLDQNVNEGQLLNLSGANGAPPLGLFIDTDLADTHTATINWGDGSPVENASIIQGMGAGALGGMHTYADQGTYTVTIAVMDNNGGSDSDTFHVIVGQVAPTATFANNGPVNEGSPATVSFSNQFDPSSADTLAGFHYAYDLNNDGIFDVGNGTYAGSATAVSQNVSTSILGDGPSDHIVKARIIDKDGQFTDYTTTIHVQNVAPILTNITGDTINENDAATVKMTIVDPSATDFFQVEANWQDGSSTTIAGLGSVDAAGTLGRTTYQWTAATRQLTLTHKYLDDGPTTAPSDTYNVSLVVRDNDLDASGPYTVPVIVNDLPPVLTVAAPQNVLEGDLLDLSGLNGAPAIGSFTDVGTLDTHTATINWGDGSPTQNATIVQGVGSGALGGTHLYADDGVYQVTVIVTDKDGKSDTESLSVTVGNRAPIVQVPHGNQSISEGQAISFADLATFADAGFDNPLNPNAADPPQIVDPLHESFTYDIDWGDGRDAVVGMAVADINGGPGVPSSGTISGSHTYADDGVYKVTVTVHDDNGGADSKTFLVTVGNQNPIVAAPNGNQAVAEGGTVSFGNLATFTDAGFDNPLNTNPFMAPAVGDPKAESFTYDINWGDGRDAITGMAVADVNGGPGVPSSGTISGSHTYADDGVYTVTITVYDDNGGVGNTSFTVTVNNVAPVVVTPHGNQSIFEGDTVSFADLATFTDPGFDNPLNPNAAVPPSITDPLHESFTYDINWGDGRDAIAGASIADVNGGPGVPSSAAISGSHTYADDGDYTVTITVHDDNGGSHSASFTVHVDNRNPVVSTPNGNQNIAEGGTVSFANLATFTDAGFDNPANPNGPVLPNIADPLNETFTYDIDWGDGRDAVAGVSIADVNGGPGVPSSGTIGGSHTYSDDGVYKVTVTVHDDNGGIGTSSFLVTVANVNPIVTTPNGNQSILEGQTVSFANLATFTDVGFDNPLNSNPFSPPAIGDPKAEAFTYDINWGDGRDAVAGASIADINGGPGVSSSGVIGGSHTYADDGNYTVTITVHDDNGGVGVAMFKVHVDNVEPTLTGTSNLVVNEGQLFTLNGLGVGVTDPGFDNPLNTLDPANGGETAETLSAMTINWGDGTATEPLALAEFQAVPFQGPTTATFPGASHTFADNGTYTVSVSIKDDDMAEFVTRTFTIEVKNVAPTLANFSSSPLTINEAGSINFNVNYSDPGFDNPLNTLDPSNGGETVESFTYDINWGDGRQEVVSAFTPDANGAPGTPSTGSFGDSHIYSDDGTYTVTITIHDDDNGSDTQTFLVHVNNVAPVIQPDGANPPFQGTDVTHEGFTHIQLQYSDVGFDNTANPNPAEPPTVTDRLHESFTHIINWGDGSIDAVHTYAQPGTYTVLVTPPGALTPLQFTVTVTDISTPPVLTLVGSQASLNDAGVVPQAYQYVVNWGDDPSGNNDAVQTITLMLKGPVGDPLLSTQTTVLQSVRTSGNEGIATTGSFDIQHRYLGPPDPLHPTQDIAISVTVLDDNMGTDAASIAIANPGIQEIFVAIDTTPDVPRLEYVPTQAAMVFIDQGTSTLQSVQNTSTRVVSSEAVVTSDRYLELVVISPEGKELQRYRLRDEALADLRGLISTLPDGHYKIYLIRTDNNSRRLVLDVYVRRGRAIEPSDSSEGTRDRPPEGAQQIQAQPLEINPRLERVREEKPAGAQNVPTVPASPVSMEEAAESQQLSELEDQPVITPSAARLRWAVPLAGLAYVATGRGNWSRDLAAAFDQADERSWKRLRRAGRVRLPR